MVPLAREGEEKTGGSRGEGAAEAALLHQKWALVHSVAPAQLNVPSALPRGPPCTAPAPTGMTPSRPLPPLALTRRYSQSASASNSAILTLAGKPIRKMNLMGGGAMDL